MSCPTRPPSQRGGQPLAGCAAGVLLLVGIGFLGDTPDTHDTAAQIAEWYSLHRTDALIAVCLLSLGALAVLSFIAAIAEQAQQAVRSLVLCAGTIATAVILITTALMHAVLAYFVDDHDPGASRVLFEMTLASTPILGPIISLLMFGTAAIRGTPTWFRVSTTFLAGPPAISTFALANSGPLSPDVAQQVVWQTFTIWLIVAGVTLSSRTTRDQGA